ncbi:MULTISPECIES: ribonuclease PH [Aminobacterium]|jgi:ribonuclease PH|uniref:ribonuclease PH n=1 Tax=Aminobacterium TaxID=81466 RepID=UPI00046730A3|nr:MULTISPECIES: ribonuclease PH [Aminobacterium]
MEERELRRDGRRIGELRSISFLRNYTRYAEGSVLACFGETKVICTASVEEKVPSFLRGTGQGWVSAEYAMLPRATAQRTFRSTTRGGVNGRSCEIQRLIGRALRSSVDLSLLGERMIWLDCDVIQADGGTRTAAISGSFVALFDALRKLWRNGIIESIPIRSFLAAVSAGKIHGTVCLDLCYEEDSSAEVDCNVVMNSKGELVEIQGTGEQGTFARSELNSMLDIVEQGIYKIMDIQARALSITSEERHACVGKNDYICER